MSKETVESLTKKVNEQAAAIEELKKTNGELTAKVEELTAAPAPTATEPEGFGALLGLFIADMERQEEEGKNVPMLGELYKLAGHGPEKED